MWNTVKLTQPTFLTPIRFILTYQMCRTLASNKMLSVTQEKFGGANELFITDSKPIPKLKENEILIRVHATALNRADLLMREGRYPGLKDVITLGLEASGTVESIGSNTSKWKVGEKVMALVNGGGYAQYVAVNEQHVMPIPPHLNFNEAAAIPEVWLTAYQLLHFVGKLKKGEMVLIHGGGSGVGTAAIQLVKLAGAHSIVTAGTENKIKFAKELGAIDGINYKQNEFSSRVMEITKKTGVNLILDCVGGSYWKQNAECLAMEGRWVLYGLLGGPKVDGALFSYILAKRASLLGTTLKARSDSYKTELINEFSQHALPYFSSDKNQLHPIIDKIFPIKSVVEAHNYMGSNKNNGKVILNFQDNLGNHSEL